MLKNLMLSYMLNKGFTVIASFYVNSKHTTHHAMPKIATNFPLKSFCANSFKAPPYKSLH
jgi:hypothetical protein